MSLRAETAGNNPVGTNGHARAPVAGAWATHAGTLAAWAEKHLVNRRDAYGGYYRKDGATLQTTRKVEDKFPPLTVQVLERHFRARSTDAVIGLHSTYCDEAGASWCRWFGIDIDRHGDDGDPDANERAAVAWHESAVSLGFNPLLYDSNGSGGFHLVVILAEPAPSETVFAFAQWLVRDWEAAGFPKPPETFPKQPGIAPGKFGNWMRLPGRHHTRDHHTRVWDGFKWLDGAAAVSRIVSTLGDDPGLIPADARPKPAAFDLGSDIERKRGQGTAAGSEHKPRREADTDGTLEPGADYNDRAFWSSVLTPHGWTLDGDDDGTGFWRRPGKAAGNSATTNHNGNDTLYVFTDATGLRQHGSYSKFGAYATLNHAGDFKAAARQLSKDGYGTFQAWVWDEDAGEWQLKLHPNPCPTGGLVRIVEAGKPCPPIPGTSKHAFRAGPNPGTNGEHKPQQEAPAADESPSPAVAPNEAADDPHRLARVYRDRHCSHPDGLTLRVWNGEFLRWDRCYQPVHEKEINAEITNVAKSEFDRINVAEITAWERRGRADDKGKATPRPAARKVSKSLVGNVTGAFTGYGTIPGKLKQPAWLMEPAPFPADEILPTRNALVHLPGFVAGGDAIRPPTPSFFCPYSLDFDFDPKASVPENWCKFLCSVWPQDPESIAALREWLGYLLTPDTKHQKIGMLIGPKRSGKGTIARVIRALLGPDNVANPTLASLGTNFGLAPLIGKPAAVITDARLSGRADIAQIVERLLSISGEDGQTIDRKHLPAVTVRLPTRFTLISNELPRLTETSGALAGRMIVFQLTRSFYGKEDLGLEAKLMAELPGILLWAIEGWKRLRDRGHFLQPKSGEPLVEELEELASPVGMFVKERCTVDPSDEVPVKTLFSEWRAWCQEKNREHAGDEASFGRNLRAVLPSLKTKQVKEKGVPYRVFMGVDLITPI